MWNKANINQLLTSDQKIKAEDIQQLTTLSKSYPYSGLIGLVLLQGLHANEDIRLDGFLSENAYKISNRERLYHLLSTPTIDQAPPIEVVDAPEIPEEIKEEQFTETKQEDPSTEAETDPLDEMIRASALNAEYTQTFEAREIELNVSKKEQTIEEDLSSTEINIPQEDTKTSPPNDFIGWLKWGQSPEESLETEKKPRTLVKIEKQKTEFYSAQKKAKESIEDNLIPVSETLAKVYILQGNINQAISIYSKLILLNPEKKPYFASQIKQLKKKITKP